MPGSRNTDLRRGSPAGCGGGWVERSRASSSPPMPTPTAATIITRIGSSSVAITDAASGPTT